GPGFLPPPHQTVHDLLDHTAYRHRSPSGMRRSGAGRSRQAVDAQARVDVVHPPSPEARSVLGAEEPLQALVDVAVDVPKLLRRIAPAKEVPPAAQHAVEVDHDR